LVEGEEVAHDGGRSQVSERATRKPQWLVLESGVLALRAATR
jgi:hypothetical protein